jgi:TRAP-type C4-dicarboxylate transport system permease small subunit
MADETGPAHARSRAGTLLAAIHDRVSEISFNAACVALAAIALCYCYEVVSRYFFAAPTVWANPVASYGLCVSIFLAAPELTRQSAHIALNLLDNLLSLATRQQLARGVRLLAAATCLVAAWIALESAWADYEMGISTITYFPIPKWWLSAFIPYAFASSAIYFVRQVFADAPAEVGQGLAA